ncbi:MAG: two-component system response regulator FlrC, partial [Pseudohongiellaceae bacterium]
MSNSIVLLVEDDGDLREALVETLEAAAFIVVDVENGDAALEVLATQHVDVVCSDVNMPGMNGIQLLQEIHKAHPALPVILMTAFGSIEHSVSAMHKGASDYLVKPFGADIFISVIKKYIATECATASELPVAEESSSRTLLQL